jgi:hypothetical protein
MADELRTEHTVEQSAEGLIGMHPLVALRARDLVMTFDLIRNSGGRKVLAQRFKNLFHGADVADIETGQVRFKQTWKGQG